MADDTKGLEAAGTDPVGEPGDAIHKPGGTPKTDWTASDTRGPLHEAPPFEQATTTEASLHSSEVLAEPTTHSEAIHPEEIRPLGEVPAAEAIRPEAVAPETIEPRRRSLVPVALAVLVGAAIGAGSAYLINQWQSASDDLPQTVAHLSGRVDALEKRPDLQPAITALKGSVATLDGKVAALQKAPGAAPAAANSPAPSPASPTGPKPVAAAAPDASAATLSTATAPASVASSSPTASSAPPGKPPTAAAPVSSPVASVAPAAPAPAFDPAPLNQKIAALQATIDNLQKQAAATTALAATVGAIQTSVNGLKTQTAEVQKQTFAVQKQTSDFQKQTSEVQKQTSDVQKTAAGAQAGVEAIQGQQKSLEGRISAPALAVVADSLVQQIDQGQPYSQQVDALATLGADPARIAVLRENARKGVPSAKALAAQFKPLEEPILATEHKAAPNASFLDRLKSGMSGLVSIRSTSDTTGNSLGASVSRLEDDLTHNDVSGAYTTWAGLPVDAKAKSDAWGALAKSTTEALDAAHALQQGAIASLGGRKS